MAQWLTDERVWSWVASITGIISFFWIGLRSEHERLQVTLKQAQSSWARGRAITWRLLPYAVGASCLLWLAIKSLMGPPVEITRHAVKLVRTPELLQVMTGRTLVDLVSREEHFRVSIEGAFFGPEIERLKRHFGSVSTVRVYGIVNDESRPVTRDLFWVQRNESGVLGEQGEYTIAAYLGGRGVDCAKDGELFAIRVYVPADPHVELPDCAVYDSLSSLPPVMFLSDPVYVKTWRRPWIDPNVPPMELRH